MSSLWSSRLAFSYWKRKGGKKREGEEESKKARQKKKKIRWQLVRWHKELGALQTPECIRKCSENPGDGNLVGIQLQGGTGLVWLLLGIQENFLFSVIDWPFYQTSLKILFHLSLFIKAPQHLSTGCLPAMRRETLHCARSFARSFHKFLNILTTINVSKYETATI